MKGLRSLRTPGRRDESADARSPLVRRVTWALVSRLLDYPTEESQQVRASARGLLPSLPAAVAAPLREFLDRMDELGLARAQQEFVQTFDLTRRCSPYLTYVFHGDTRRRGMALLRLKQTYAAHGLHLGPDELPDHLAVVLEFGVAGDLDAAAQVLEDYRAGVEVLRIALSDKGSAWTPLVVALTATLPELRGDEELAVRRLVEAGPPAEDVGLSTYPLDPRLSAEPGSGRTPVALGDRIPVGAPR